MICNNYETESLNFKQSKIKINGCLTHFFYYKNHRGTNVEIPYFFTLHFYKIVVKFCFVFRLVFCICQHPYDIQYFS